MGDMVENVQELMARHPSILSMTKTGTKTMDQTFLRIRQLMAGEFMFAYTWDRPWFNKVSARWPVEKLRFASQDEVLDRLDDVRTTGTTLCRAAAALREGGAPQETQGCYNCPWNR